MIFKLELNEKNVTELHCKKLCEYEELQKKTGIKTYKTISGHDGININIDILDMPFSFITTNR